MRPVRLEMTGFASFREPAVVDFTDADYFALVGATGSGKSTVIDAMTFALYGSAPRWNNRAAIADALAPTTNRCTVRLLFDLGGARYVVAREVRRIGKTVQQKNAVLERLADPRGTGAAGEEPGEVLAGDPRQLTEEVEKLLGLSFSDFCQCIVLPQGQFAAFLGATPKQRQGILLKLLGADQYEHIARAATQRSVLAEQSVTLLSAQLGDLASSTAEAEDAARAQEGELRALALAVDSALPVLAEAEAAISRATSEHERLRAEHDLLASLVPPADLGDLASGVARARARHQQAEATETIALDADGAARAALAAGPSRSALQLTLQHRREQDELTGRRGTVAGAEEAARAQETSATGQVDLAERAVTATREQHEGARAFHAAAGDALTALQSHRSILAAIRTPEGVGQLGVRAAAAREALRTSKSRREQAENADEQARTGVESAPTRAPLEQALRDLQNLARIESRLSALIPAHQKLQADTVQAHQAGAQAQQALAEARQHEQDARATSAAAALRPHLVAGHACPVCDQTVATLPPPLDAPELAAAEKAVAGAQQAVDRAQGAVLELLPREAAAAAQVDSATTERDRLAAALAGHGQGGRPPDAETLTAALAHLDALSRAAQDAGRVLVEARRAEIAAGTALQDLDAEVSAARGRLRTTHGTLLASGAPDLNDSDLPGAWATLTAWSRAQIADLDDAQIPVAQKNAREGEHTLSVTGQELRSAEQQLATARIEHTEALKAAEQAGAAHRWLTERLDFLDTLLAGAPTADEASTQLALCADLETAAEQAALALAAARTARIGAGADLQHWDSALQSARTDLRAARDRLVALGAPGLEDTDVASAWAQLTSWAAGEAGIRTEQIPRAADLIASTSASHAQQLAALLATVREQGLLITDDVRPAALPALVATAAERAHAQVTQIAENRRRASTLNDKLAQAQEEQQVAKLLGDLLRSDKFPRWLAAAALDTLVADASAALFDLSGGQFDLTHERGEFMVIDHTDADSTRSVRTLSGGETFQASLALALALSEQLSTLAAEGAAHLDSIFLDEGFGTLDPDTLDIVAGTLENLAGGERMVGVITHVAALADRAPVRFAVRRDNRGSTISREGE